MPIDLNILCRDIKPEKTVLLFGAGSSIPSGGLTGAQLSKQICDKFGVDYDPTLLLSDIATLAELRRSRRELILFLREKFESLLPTRGLLNLPQYPWKDLFTTNYDNLIEVAFAKNNKGLKVISSNFDFQGDELARVTNLFKLHGTLAHDRSMGHNSRLIITSEDYDRSSEYRELVYDRLLHETSRNDVVIIGQSLADPDLNLVLNEAIRRKRDLGAGGRLYALVYSPDECGATLIERRGFQVCFGGLDDFFAELNKVGPDKVPVHSEIGDVFDGAPQLRPVTIDVSHSLQHELPNVLQLFNGSSASYGDIKAGLTFPRDVSISIETHLSGDERSVAYLLGPAGFGKTTAARQIMTGLSRRGALCWKHKVDYHLDGAYWNVVADACQTKSLKGILFVDNAHTSLRQIDVIVDHLASTTNSFFKLLLASSPGRWHPRSKTPYLFKIGKEYNINKLSNSEINSLIDMFYDKGEIAVLVEGAFSGFSRQEKFRRLTERCRADMFVCMKNIFGFDSLGDIILRDYGQMENELQDIYMAVAAMEASNGRSPDRLPLGEVLAPNPRNRLHDQHP